MADRDNLLTPHVNKMHKALGDNNVGPHFLSFFVVSGSLSGTCTNWHTSPLPQWEKCPAFFSSKQKGNKLKFRTTNGGPAYLVIRKAGGGRTEKKMEEEEKEEEW